MQGMWIIQQEGDHPSGSLMKEEAYAGYLPGTFAVCRDYEIIPTVSLRDMSGFEETETGKA